MNQGIAVYGNKGSTDQHAYVQQLREGVKNFFVTFIDVLKDRAAGARGGARYHGGDYLQGFLLGTRDALSEKDRWSITLTLPDVSPRTIGMLIALYERVVGLYASLDRHQRLRPARSRGRQEGRHGVIALQQSLVAALKAAPRKRFTAEALAAQVGGDPELAFKILEHLSANGSVRHKPRKPWFESTYSI